MILRHYRDSMLTITLRSSSFKKQRWLTWFLQKVWTPAVFGFCTSLRFLKLRIPSSTSTWPHLYLYGPKPIETIILSLLHISNLIWKNRRIVTEKICSRSVYHLTQIRLCVGFLNHASYLLKSKPGSLLVWEQIFKINSKRYCVCFQRYQKMTVKDLQKHYKRGNKYLFENWCLVCLELCRKVDSHVRPVTQ